VKFIPILRMRKLLFVTFIIIAGCNKLYPVDVGVDSGRGIVRRVDFEHHMVTLSHGTVPNLLHPMTYAYPVKTDSLMRGLQPNDTISFTIQEIKPGSFLILSMKKIHGPFRRVGP